MKALSIITYLLVSGLYLILFVFRKEILKEFKETCKLLFTWEVEDDN